MRVLSIRRITNDRHHNAFTGACWFKGDLYVGYRQGDDHECPRGRIVVMRSRDAGITWDTVAVLRGDVDTRDAALYTDGRRLHAVGIENAGGPGDRSSFSVTEDGDRWTPFRPFEGVDGFMLWRPVWYDGRHYCAGYRRDRENGFGVHWFESEDGQRWNRTRVVHESADEMPNECFLEILPDGTATMLMRCEGSPKHPYLCQSQHPFTSWDMQRLEDISLTGPAAWTVDGRIYISGRWHPLDERVAEEEDYFAHTAVFRVRDGKTYLICVLPSGPGPDHSYMGVARWPTNRHRFALSFYGNALANEDPAIPQWNHPDIYVADVLFGQ
ncbi:MAG TPA: sialidase family protein [Armatimonadota bacterium]|nr:sialidase family protein [Armatimonadota bacterium]